MASLLSGLCQQDTPNNLLVKEEAVSANLRVGNPAIPGSAPKIGRLYAKAVSKNARGHKPLFV